MTPGDFVRVRLKHERGTSHRYHNLVGMVRVVKDDEIGVQFTLAHHVTWFRHDELVPDEMPAWWEPAIIDNNDLPDMRKP